MPAAAAVPASARPTALRGSLTSERALRVAFSNCSRDGLISYLLPHMGPEITRRDVKTPLRRLAAGRERLVQVTLVACHLLSDPAGRLEPACLLLRRELDFRHDQAIQLALV